MKILSKVLHCLTFFLICFFINISFTNAAEVTNDFSGYYWYRTVDGSSHVWSDSFNYYYVDGEDAYCLDINTKEGGPLTLSTLDLSGVPENVRNRVLLIAFYGYNYYGHQTLEYRAATQALIWETVEGPNTKIRFFTDLFGVGTELNIENQRREIENLISNYNILPSFNGNTYKIQVGQTLSLVDENYALSRYRIEAHGLNYSTSGSSMTIKPIYGGNYDFVFNPRGPYNHNYKIYIGEKYQNMIVPGNTNLVSGKMTVNAYYTNISINKHDIETGSVQGDATFDGALYEIYNKENDRYVKAVRLDSSGSDVFTLPYGLFYIKEAYASKGYLLDSTIYEIDTRGKESIKLDVNEQVIKGNIRITKYDYDTKTCLSSGEGNLEGAKYQILDNKGNIVDVLLIDETCTATSKELPYGKYYIKEIEAPTGYELDFNNYEVNVLNDGITIDVTLYDKIIRGRIILNKYDKDTNRCLPSGEGSLEGAKYQVLDSKGNIVDILLIDKTCTAISKELPYGKYYVNEIETPTGYLLDNNTYEFLVDKAYVNRTSNIIISLEQIITNKINITKSYEGDNTNILNSEENITFEIYDINNNKYSKITTDKNGQASILLPYGTWIFHQVNSLTGYEKIDDFTVIVSENSEQNQFFNILNKRISAYLKVIKIDSENKQPILLEKTSFKIFNVDKDEYVKQYVGGKYLDTFYTDEMGVMTTYLKLDYGHYKLIETRSPKGYLINDPLEFSIENNEDLTIYFENDSLKGNLEIFKIGEEFNLNNGNFSYSKKTLESVRFRVYADEDIYSSDGQTLYYSKGKVVDTLVTDINGYTKSKDLPFGKYYVTETKTLDGYIQNTEKYYFEITEDNTNIKYEPFNYLKKGKVEITKKDELTGESLPHTKIEIYTDNNELIFTGITDDKGKIILENLPLGSYYIIEKESPTGYILSNEKVYFDIVRHKQNVKLIITNKPIIGSLQFLKVNKENMPLEGANIQIYDENNKIVYNGKTDKNGMINTDLKYGKYYTVEKEAPLGYAVNENKIFFEIFENKQIVNVTMEDEKIKSLVRIKKVDNNNTPLKNVKIGLYDDKDNLIYEEITDENGNIVVELEYGKYYYKEIETVDGYILSEEKVFFEVNKNDEILEYTLVNNKISIDVPDTEKNNNIIDYLSYIILSIGNILTIYGLKKI